MGKMYININKFHVLHPFLILCCFKTYKLYWKFYLCTMWPIVAIKWKCQKWLILLSGLWGTQLQQCCTNSFSKKERQSYSLASLTLDFQTHYIYIIII